MYPDVIETSIGVDRMFLSVMCGLYAKKNWKTARPVLYCVACCFGTCEVCRVAVGEERRSARKGSRNRDDLKFHFNTAIR